MNSKQSIWKLLFACAGVGFLVTNCTIQSASDKGSAGDTGSAATGNISSGECTAGHKLTGCTCPGKLTGYQVCGSDGTYVQSCVCPAAGEGGAPADNGGASSVAGKPSGGGYAGTYVAPEAGSAGEGGSAGVAGVIDPTDCTGCLVQKCAVEWGFCSVEDENSPPDPDFPNDYCLSSTADGSGQIEQIMDCITAQRAMGLVKRDVVRACGSSIGASASTTFFVWAPKTMTAATEALMNCMADDPNETVPGAWATDSNNFPPAGPLPWSDGTCAKLSCTSAE
jgi:hypothetical protein